MAIGSKVCTYLRHERRETSNRIDDSTASSFKPRERLFQPSSPYYHGDTKESQGDSGNNLGEEPNFPLHGCQLEFCVARHCNNTAHDGSIASGEDYPNAFSLDDKGGIEGEIAGLHCIC